MVGMCQDDGPVRLPHRCDHIFMLRVIVISLQIKNTGTILDFKVSKHFIVPKAEREFDHEPKFPDHGLYVQSKSAVETSSGSLLEEREADARYQPKFGVMFEYIRLYSFNAELRPKSARVLFTEVPFGISMHWIPSHRFHFNLLFSDRFRTATDMLYDLLN